MNRVYGGQGDLQRPNGAAAAADDFRGSTNGKPNFDHNGTAGAAYLYGAAAVASGLDREDAMTAAGQLNKNSTNPDHSGPLGLPDGRADQIGAGYDAVKSGAISPDGATPQDRIDAINAANNSNLLGFAGDRAATFTSNMLGKLYDSVDQYSDDTSRSDVQQGSPSAPSLPPTSAPSLYPLQGDFPAATPAAGGTSTSSAATSADGTQNSPSSPQAVATTATDPLAAGGGSSNNADANFAWDDPSTLTHQDISELTPDFASWNTLLNGGGSDGDGGSAFA